MEETKFWRGKRRPRSDEYLNWEARGEKQSFRITKKNKKKLVWPQEGTSMEEETEGLNSNKLYECGILRGVEGNRGSGTKNREMLSVLYHTP